MRRLRLRRMEERHASWLELFFDLVFVVAIAELSLGLVRDHSLGGFGIFGGVRDRVFRVAMLAARSRSRRSRCGYPRSAPVATTLAS
jgi:hypothetical protein